MLPDSIVMKLIKSALVIRRPIPRPVRIRVKPQKLPLAQRRNVGVTDQGYRCFIKHITEEQVTVG